MSRASQSTWSLKIRSKSSRVGAGIYLTIYFLEYNFSKWGL